MARINFYLRATLCVLWFFITTTLGLFVCVIRWRNPNNGYLMSHTFTVGAMKILGYNVVVRNRERLTGFQPCIYICNHQSNLDILIQAYAFPPRTVCIGKKEVIWIPLFGLLFYLSGNILIDRKHHQNAVARLRVVERYVLRKKLSVYMFPEGTRNHGAETLLPFKKGAFHMAVGTQVPLIPVVASPIHETVDLKNKILHKKDIIVNILEPIFTAGKTDSDVPSLMQLAQSRMQKAFDDLKTEVRKPHAVT